jgi:hypothetical protein
MRHLLLTRKRVAATFVFGAGARAGRMTTFGDAAFNRGIVAGLFA